LSIVDEYAVGAIGLDDVAEKAIEVLSSMVQLRQATHLAPAMAALAQLGNTQLDPAWVVNRIRELLNNLHDQVQTSYTAYTTAENTAIENYNTEKEHLEGQLSDLEAEEEILRHQISEMNLCIIQEEAVQHDAAAKIARNTQLLNDATNLCQTYFEQYQTATEGRNDELRILAELRAVVASRFAQFSAGALHRGDEDTFSTYENESEFHSANPFEKHGGEFNEGGAEQTGFHRDTTLEAMI